MAREKTPGRGSDQFPLRLPDGMREQIKAEAFKNGQRSMNQEIVERLRQSLALPSLDIPNVLLERMALADERTRAQRGRMLVDDLHTYFPPPPPPRKIITFTTKQMIESLEKSVAKTPDMIGFIERLKKQMESGEIDGDAPTQFGVPPDYDPGEVKK